MHYTEEQLAAFEKAIAMFRSDVTTAIFSTFFSSLKLFAVTEEAIIIEAPNAMVVEQLRARHFQTLSNVLGATFGRAYDIRILTPEEIKNQYREMEKTMLNPKYTFENFVVGNSNSFAHAAALAVADDPSGAYNPLFIYGGVGLGKTHLMHAIGHFINEENPAARVMYVTSETFTNELITAIQQDKRLEFRKRYRSVDILLIDDVQFISKSQATQEEFFNTFNTLHNANKQIVISSDRPPKEIAKLEERLCSRFQWGLITDIQPPDIETRIAILRNRARIDNIEVGDDVLQFIADHVQSNIRELEGCLTRVVAFSRLRRRPLNLEVTAEALKDLLPDVKKREVTPQLIKQTVAEFYSISVESMDSQRRDREVVMPRQIAMYLCHRMLSLPYKRIAYLFGRNDHTTAMSACDKIDKMIAEDARFASVIEDLKKRM